MLNISTLSPPPVTMADAGTQGYGLPYGKVGRSLLGGCHVVDNVFVRVNKMCGCGRSRNTGMAGAYERLYAIFLYDGRMRNCDFIPSNLYVKN